MMLYFEVRGRLNTLLKFRQVYKEYSDFTNKENNLPAQMLRERLEPSAAMTVDSLRKVGLGTVVTRDAPNKGGRRIRVNLIKAIFRDHIWRHFHLEDGDVLNLLDKGIVRYRAQLWRQRFNLFNPLFWLYSIGGFMADLPLLICRKAGYSTDHAESLVSVRLFRLAVQICFFFAAFKYSGLIDFVRFDILAL
ncbi:MAG: hypothetical protein V3T31_13585 [candidate division Zixibacteria bacterium]